MKNAMGMAVALLCGCAGFVIVFADGRRALAADCETRGEFSVNWQVYRCEQHARGLQHEPR